MRFMVLSETAGRRMRSSRQLYCAALLSLGFYSSLSFSLLLLLLFSVIKQFLSQPMRCEGFFACVCLFVWCFFALILTPSPHPSPGVPGVCELSGKLTDCKQLEMLSLFPPSTYQENPMNHRWKDIFIFEWFFWVCFTSWYFSRYLLFKKHIYSKISVHWSPLKTHRTITYFLLVLMKWCYYLNIKTSACGI